MYDSSLEVFDSFLRFSGLRSTLLGTPSGCAGRNIMIASRRSCRHDGAERGRRCVYVRVAPVLVILLLACGDGAPAAGGDGAPAEALRAAAEDSVVRALSVAREDQEPCAKDADCDDWCKERHDQQWAACLCRCPAFIPEAQLACAPEARFCQPSPAPFWGGSFNLTSGKPFKAMCKKHPLMLVVFSARTCLHCIDFEPSYRWGADALAPLGIPLARIDVDVEKVGPHPAGPGLPRRANLVAPRGARLPGACYAPI